MLHSLITSKTRIRLLVKFFLSVTNSGYLRGLAQEMNENTNAIRKELNNLSEAGYILREEQDGKIIYRANEQHSLFATLQQLIRKYVGIDVANGKGGHGSWYNRIVVGYNAYDRWCGLFLDCVIVCSEGES